MSVRFLSSVYEHINRGGLVRLLGLSKDARYRAFRETDLANLGIDANLSSVEVFKADVGFSNVLLFSNIWPFIGDFSGNFRQVIDPNAASPTFVNLTDSGFNDATRSIMLVSTSRGPEFRISFRDAFLDTWNTTLDEQLGSQAERKGDPVMTWEPFPQGISYLDSNQIYLKIHQPLNIVIDWWPDYDASITYHLFLYLDGGGKVRGYVARWAYWVEGGIKSGKIAEKLEPKVKAGMGTINAKLAERLNPLPAVKGLYFLPGFQRSLPSGPVFSGSTFDDVTIVVEF